MSEDQFENRATYSKSCWALRDRNVDVSRFCLSVDGFPLLSETKDLAEAEILRLVPDALSRLPGARPRLMPVEVVVTVIEKPAE